MSSEVLDVGLILLGGGVATMLVAVALFVLEAR